MDTKAPKLTAVVMLVLFLSLGVTPAYSQTDDESVQAALTRGYSVSGSYVSDCEASRRGGGLLGRLGSALIDSLATSFDVLRWGGEGPGTWAPYGPGPYGSVHLIRGLPPY